MTENEDSKNTQADASTSLVGDHISPQMRQRIQSSIQAANFGNIVAILMNAPGYKDRPLSEIKKFVVPPLVKNQFLIAEAYKKGSGLTTPVGLGLWARVSDEVDQRLSENLEDPIELSADEWTSGDNYWLIELMGEKRAVYRIVTSLRKDVFKDKVVKCRTLNENGEQVVTELASGASAAAGKLASSGQTAEASVN